MNERPDCETSRASEQRGREHPLEADQVRPAAIDNCAQQAAHRDQQSECALAGGDSHGYRQADRQSGPDHALPGDRGAAEPGHLNQPGRHDGVAHLGSLANADHRVLLPAQVSENARALTKLGGARAGVQASRPPYAARGPPVSVERAPTRSVGVPSKTILPPSCPAPGPRSMIQSAWAMTAWWCSMTITDLPDSTSRSSRPSNCSTSARCRPLVGSSRT